jgi:uroporphyrin-III C-methyltransferase
MAAAGIVYLVGAGPGDPDLITVKGAKCLQLAEVVVYDRLANPALLDLAPPWAEKIFAGKEPQRHRLDQDEINNVLIIEAQKGKTVVRLKGGDPFVFGRGGEECLALAAANVPFVVVPGISSAIAVPAVVGIPVTHRQVAQTFTVVTGHTADDPFGTNWDDLPRSGTLVILMGVKHLPQIVERLLANGRSPTTPAATIRAGTLPEQEMVVGTLADIAAKAQYLPPPAITIVGEVVGVYEQLATTGARFYGDNLAVAKAPLEFGG